MLWPFLITCAALSPAVDGGSSPSYTAIEDVTPQWRPWSQDSGNQTPGLDYFSGRIQKPRMTFHVIRVDLNDPSLKIVINHEAGKAPGAISSTFVSSFVRSYDCLAGINTAPFDVSSGREGEARVIKGISIVDGILFSPPHPAYDALVFYKDGRAAIVKQSEIAQSDIETFDDIENAAGGFYRVLEQGELAARLFTEDGSLIKNTPSYPRSAAGLSPDGRYLYLLVIDGRQRNSAGATGAETGRLLLQLGASEGLYFDGGGSTALALRYPDGQVKVVNTPVHNNIPGRERAVATCLGIARR